MNKLLTVAVLITLYRSLWATPSHGPEIVVPNKGVAGQIAVSEGALYDSEHTKAKWVNPEDVPGLKGAKGDKGEKGDASKGDTGAAGKDGNDANVKSLEDGLHKQSQTAIGVEGAIRLYDSKHIQLQLFDMYNVRGGRNFFFGGRVIVKIGKSYEEKLLDEINRKISILMSVAHRPGAKQDYLLNELERHDHK